MINRIVFAISVLAVLLLLIRDVHADLHVYEPFDYPAETELDGLAATGLNLTGSYNTSTPQDLVIATPGLDHGSLPGNLPEVVGNRLSDASGAGAGSSTVSLTQAVPTGPGQGIYFSALFTLDDAGNGNRFARIALLDEATGDSITFGEPVVGSRGVRIDAITATLGDQVADGADNAFIDGHTYWLIGRYLNSDAAEGDLLQLVGYDTAGTAPPAEQFNVDDPAAAFGFTVDEVDIDFAQVTDLRFEIRGQDNNFLDEFRLGDTYMDVAIPEPIVTPLLGLLLLRRR